MASLNPVIHIASVSGGQIEYCLSGNGPTVLISHGTLGGFDQGFSISRLFNREIFRYLSVSRAGYLNSSPNTGRTSKEQARSYAELLDREEINSVAIIGISGGAPSALRFAQDYPERCWGLILISSIVKMPELPPFFKLAVQMQDFMMRVNWPWRFVYRYGLGMMARANGASSKQVSNMRRDPHLWSVIQGIYEPIKTARMRRKGLKIDDAQIKSLPAAEEYDINVPIYISHAVNDPLASFEDARSFASHFPQATFHDIPDGGHIFFVIHNKNVIPNIEQFLLANAPKSRVKKGGVISSRPPAGNADRWGGLSPRLVREGAIVMNLSTTGLSLPSNAAIDLQLHTTYSDGHWTDEQLLDYLIAERFSLAAITDHDRVDTARGLQKLAAEKQFPLMVAVEMSAMWKGKLTDLLCYGFDPDDNHLDALAQDVTYRQHENTRQVFNYLLSKGYALDPQDLERMVAKPAAQQLPELLALATKIIQNEKAIGRTLLDGGFAYMTHDPATIVEAAHQSGAVCILAHPGRSDGFVCYDLALLDELRGEAHIDGIEAYYPVHTPEQTAMYRDYAEHHHLLISAGSDSHSSNKPPIKYKAELCRDLLERVSI